MRGCPPPGQRLRIDMNNLVGVLRSPGRLIIQGDLDFVNLGWGGMAQVSDDSDSPSIVPGFTAVTGTTGATGSVEFEVRVLRPALMCKHSHAAVQLSPTACTSRVLGGS